MANNKSLNKRGERIGLKSKQAILDQKENNC